MAQRETREAVNPAMLAVGCRQDVLVSRQHVGVFRAFDNPRRIVRVGENGQADMSLIVAVTVTEAMVGKTIGVAVQAEGKTKKGRQSQHQKDWQAAVEKRGGVYGVVRSAEDMNELVEQVTSGRAFR